MTRAHAASFHVTAEAAASASMMFAAIITLVCSGDSAWVSSQLVGRNNRQSNGHDA